MSKHPPRIFIEGLGADYTSMTRRGLDWIDVRSKIKWGDSVFIKPNLTFPVHRKGVMTSPGCIEAMEAIDVLPDLSGCDKR